MFKHICLTACLLTAACVPGTKGYDDAKRRQDVRECFAEAQEVTPVSWSWSWGGAIGGALYGVPVLGPALGPLGAGLGQALSDKNAPHTPSAFEQHQRECLVARGYPAGSDP